jgi:hypothetical protein
MVVYERFAKFQEPSIGAIGSFRGGDADQPHEIPPAFRTDPW